MSKSKVWQAPEKRLVWLASLLLIGATLAILRNGSAPLDVQNAPAPEPAGGRGSARAAAGRRLPIYFIPNASQTDPRVKFYALGRGYSFFLTGNEAAYSFIKKVPTPPARRGSTISAAGRTKTSGYAMKIRFEGANPNPRVLGGAKLATRVNYILGRDRSHWRTNLPA